MRVLKLGLALVLLGALQAVVIFDLDVVVLRPTAGLLTLLVLPTLVLYKRARLPGDSAVTRFSYAVGVTVLAVILSALAVNTLLPLVDISRPLTPRVLGLTWLGVDAVLLCWRPSIPLLPPHPLRTAVRRTWGARLNLAEAAAVVAVVLAVFGAIRLNNGASGHVALAAQLLVAAAVTALLVRQGSLGRDCRVLFLAAIVLLLATSLRGWGITGHDIQVEYLAFSLTNGAQHWSMALYQNAYNACLSVTILPAALVQVTGLSGVVVFKVVLQVLFALVPVLVYLVSRRFLSRRLALAGVVFVMAFPTFSTDMPYLVRQEVAFVFLSLMLLAATEPGRSPRLRRVLVVVFGLGVVLTHYSTTYLMLLGLVIGLLLLVGVRLLARLLRRSRASRQPLVLLSPVVVGLIALLALAWSGPITHTGHHAEDVARGALGALFGGGDDRPGSSDVSFTMFGQDASPRARLDLFVDQTLKLREDVSPDLLLIQHPGPAETSPAIVEADAAPLTPAGRKLEEIGVPLGAVAIALRLGCAVLLQGFLLIGLWRLVVVARRREPAVTPELACMALGVMAALGLVVVIPNLSVEYGVLRAFMQTMLFLAPVAAAGMWWIVQRLGRAATAVTVVVPIAILLILTGTALSLLGGNPAKLALHNVGLYHDRYIAADSDEETATRLAEAPDTSGQLAKVLTSRNQVGRVVAAGVPEVDVADRIYPTLLTTGSYVFVDARLHEQLEATIFYSGDRITYTYPLDDLDQLLDLVYSAGASRVYR